MARQVSRERGIGIVVTALAVGAMAVDHLMGSDPGLEDPPVFVASTALSLLLAALVFGVLVPRTKARGRDSGSAATRAIVCSALAVLAFPLTLWLGLPFVLGGGGIALGLLGRDGSRRRLATAAIVIGAAVIIVATALYAAAALGVAEET